MGKLCLALLLGIALAACAAPVQHHTASGRPEVTINAPAAAIKPVMINDMINWGYYPVQDTPYILTMDRPSDNAMANALLGSSYNGQVNTRLTFTLTESQGSTRVVANMAVVTNPGSGFEKLTPMNNAADSAQLQQWLTSLRGRF